MTVHARQRPRAHLVVAMTVLAMSVASAGRASAQMQPFAPVDQPGPALSVPQARLRASLECSPGFGPTSKEPVLLVPGTWMSFDTFFRWSYAEALSRLRIPWCGVTLPDNNTGDIQLAAEYEVHAIRYMFERSGQRIAIVGHSQGGMQPRWALRFWPDTRSMVADHVGLAPDNQGGRYFGLSSSLQTGCSVIGSCPTTVWQQLRESNFIRALNSGQQMFDEVDYSVIYSRTDGLIAPEDAQLHGPGSYSFTALQDVCAGNTATHVTDGSTDPVAWALVLDAITHDGPADPARLPRSVCYQLIVPGMKIGRAAASLERVLVHAAQSMATMSYVPAEPPLRCYVTNTCRSAGSSGGV